MVWPGALVVVDDCEADPRHPFFAEYTPVGTAWRHAVGDGTVVALPDACGHVALCVGHYPAAAHPAESAPPKPPAAAAVEREGSSSSSDGVWRLPPDESAALTFTTPQHGAVLEPPAAAGSANSGSANSAGGDAVRALVVVSVAVELGLGRAADAVRAAPNEWQLCCEASRAEAVAATGSATAAAAAAATVDAPPPTCVGLGRGALPAVPLPGRRGAAAAARVAGPSVWRLEAWLERAHRSVADGRHLGPRAVVGLTAIEIVG